MSNAQVVFDYRNNILRAAIIGCIAVTASYIALFLATSNPLLASVCNALFLLLYVFYLLLLGRLNVTLVIDLVLWTAVTHVALGSLFLLQQQTATHFFLLAAGPAACTVLDAKRSRYRTFVLIATFALFLMIEVLPHPTKISHLDRGIVEVLRLVNLTSTFALISVPITLFSVQIQNNEQTYYNQSIRDPLTTLYNRSYLMEYLRNIHEVSRRYQRCYSILLIDVDHFKSVNDNHGHSAGDTVLKEICKTLSFGIRKSDTAFRYGGEEFVILLPETAAAGAQIIAERLRTNISNIESQVPGVKTTVSIGIGLGPGADDFESVINQADDCLYQAKKSGRNQVRCLD